MAFTMHSHSGEFCPGHAKDDLETILQQAIKIGFRTMGLSEHMPRVSLEDLYPEELEPSAEECLKALAPRHDAYITAAQRLRAQYAGSLEILIGFEAEWIRDADYGPLVKQLAAHPAVDYVVGAVHHVLGVPIDFDAATYGRACDAAVASPLGFAVASPLDDGDESRERALYNAYYAAQRGMLEALRPKVVGHLDVVRLLSKNPSRRIKGDWPEVWGRIVGNLELVRGQGGLLECNSSALRKGLRDPYPSREIAETWVAMRGKWTLSDDSHGAAQVGASYARMVAFLQGLGVDEVWTLRRGDDGVVERRVALVDVMESLHF